MKKTETRAEEARSICAGLTRDEKIRLCSGLDFWHLEAIEGADLPSVMLTDGPHGLRKQKTAGDHIGLGESVPATCFPTAATLACSWDRRLLEDVGEALGDECRAEKVSVLLGPGINIKRNPLCGRNFEYFSEDPLLSGELAAAFIRGVQSRGIGTSLKHFAVNNQEYYRLVTDARVDERTLRELYLTGFEIAVKKGRPWTVMCAYNRLNGEYCSDSRRLLTDILREEWGFDGLVMSDWGAVNDRVAGIHAGMDLEMPGSGGAFDGQLRDAVESGRLSASDLDRSAGRVVELMLRSRDTLRSIDGEEPPRLEEHHLLARRAAARSAVLLKNEDSLLPLSPDQKIAVLGEMAAVPRFQGNGSSLVNPAKVETAFDEMRRRIDESGAAGEVLFTRDPEEAPGLAGTCDAAVFFAGLPQEYESEGYDREHLRIPREQVELIRNIASVQKRLVVVLSNGAPVEMEWLDDASAVLELYLGGQAAGGAAADILFGTVNPSGKLAETFPRRLEDLRSSAWFPGSPSRVEYREGLDVGYRYYDRAGEAPLFPFGYGLSYTTFEYDDLQISASRADEAELSEWTGITASVRVRNTGDTAGSDIVQLYVHDVESGVRRPQQELKGFEKVYLEPGESRRVEFELGRRAFAFYHTATASWRIEDGDFEIRVGASSRDIRLKGTLSIASPFPSSPPGPSGEPDGAGAFEPEKESNRPFTLNSPLSDVRRTLPGWFLYRLVVRETARSFGSTSGRKDKASEEMLKKSVDQMPLRLIVLFGGGRFSFRRMNALIDILNGRILRGMFRLI